MQSEKNVRNVLAIVFGVIAIVVSFLLCNSPQNNSSYSTPTQTKIPTRIPTKYSTSTPIPKIPVATVLMALNVRRWPDALAPIITTVEKNTQLMIVGENQDGSWLAVLMDNGGYAWVSGNPEYVTRGYIYVDSTTYREWESGVQYFNGSLASKPTTTANVGSGGYQNAVCICSYNAYDCPDFTTQASAQACYSYCMSTVGYDVHWLDEDGDGIACEWNP
jgi:hypothetical protein